MSVKHRRKVTDRKAKPTRAPAKAQTPRKPIALDAMTVFRAQHQAQKAKVQEIFQTTDGFDNFLSRVGLRNNNALSASEYTFNLLTRNRLQLEAAYRGSWVVGAVVDSIAEDMTRAGLDINVPSDDGDIRKIQSAISRLQVWQTLCSGIKWGRLYGGAVGVIQIEGQDYASPLDVDTIRKGQFRGIVNFDRWMINPQVDDAIDSGPDMGLPTFYQVVTDPNSMSPAQAFMINQKVHYTRVIRHIGIELPYFQAITEWMWGESVLERLWDRLISFDNATMSSAQLIDRANLRTVQIDKLREVLAAGAEATQGLYAQFDMMREMQVNEGLTLLDKEDTFSSTAYSFAGLSDMLLQFGQQLAGATEIPLVRLFGQSPAGLNSTGESDLRMYYDNIKARQESKLRNPWETLLKVLWASELGKPAPDDMTFKFTPLWQMSATDKANNGKTIAETISGAYNDGIISRKTALTELRDSSAETGLFTNITDEDIEEADQDEPPMPDDDAALALSGAEPQKALPPPAKEREVQQVRDHAPRRPWWKLW